MTPLTEKHRAQPLKHFHLFLKFNPYSAPIWQSTLAACSKAAASSKCHSGQPVPLQLHLPAAEQPWQVLLCELQRASLHLHHGRFQRKRGVYWGRNPRVDKNIPLAVILRSLLFPRAILTNGVCMPARKRERRSPAALLETRLRAERAAEQPRHLPPPPHLPHTAPAPRRGPR